MIEDIFGKPNLPSVISNCFLFFDNGEHFYIDKIYIFNKSSFREVIKFGEIWVNGHVFSGIKITGYFSTSDYKICLQDKNPSRIIGKVGKDITYIITGINIRRINQNILPDYCAYIRFDANILNERREDIK